MIIIMIIIIINKNKNNNNNNNVYIYIYDPKTARGQSNSSIEYLSNASPASCIDKTNLMKQENVRDYSPTRMWYVYNLISSQIMWWTQS